MMSSEGHFDVQFNDALDEKLGSLLELPIEEMKEGIQQLRKLLQERNQRRCLQLTDEMELMPAEMRCAVFGHFDDSDLVDVIIAFPEFESTAGYVMQRRKYVTFLEVGDGPLKFYSNRELRMVCNIWKCQQDYDDKEKQPDHSIVKRLRFSTEQSLSDYICGFVRVVCLFMPASDHGILFNYLRISSLDPENYFGPAPNDVIDKCTGGQIHIRCDVFAPFLRWISPKSLIYNADPKLLFDSRGKLTIEGVDDVKLDGNAPVRIWSDVMEKSRAKMIRIGPCAFWSRRSFNAVLTEHALSGEDGVDRVIEIERLQYKKKESRQKSSQETDGEAPEDDFRGWPLAVWIQRLADWRIGHVAKYGEPARDVTYEVLRKDIKVKTFRLILH